MKKETFYIKPIHICVRRKIDPLVIFREFIVTITNKLPATIGYCTVHTAHLPESAVKPSHHVMSA